MGEGKKTVAACDRRVPAPQACGAVQGFRGQGEQSSAGCCAVGSGRWAGGLLLCAVHAPEQRQRSGHCHTLHIWEWSPSLCSPFLTGIQPTRLSAANSAPCYAFAVRTLCAEFREERTEEQKRRNGTSPPPGPPGPPLRAPRGSQCAHAGVCSPSSPRLPREAEPGACARRPSRAQREPNGHRVNELASKCQLSQKWGT